MAMDLPPNAPVPAIHAPAPECHFLTNAEAQEAFRRLRTTLSGTSFDNARPSEVCGMVRVEMSSGKVVYTDATGRYLLLAFALDTHKGSPADTSAELERVIEDRATYPSSPIPGVFPPNE